MFLHTDEKSSKPKIHNEEPIGFDYDLEANQQAPIDYEKILGKNATPMDAFRYGWQKAQEEFENKKLKQDHY